MDRLKIKTHDYIDIRILMFFYLFIYNLRTTFERKQTHTKNEGD